MPGQAEWFLPRGQGLDQLVTAAHGEHQQWFERQSALALVGSRLFGPHQEVPPPALLFSEVRLDQPRLPRFGDRAAPPQTDRSPKRRTGTGGGGQSPAPGPEVPALAVVNRISGTTATVASLRGTLRQRPVTGALRWTRNADGVITSVLVTVVTATGWRRGRSSARCPGRRSPTSRSRSPRRPSSDSCRPGSPTRPASPCR